MLRPVRPSLHGRRTWASLPTEFRERLQIRQLDENFTFKRSMDAAWLLGIALCALAV